MALIFGEVTDPIYGQHFALYANCTISELYDDFEKRTGVRPKDEDRDSQLIGCAWTISYRQSGDARVRRINIVWIYRWSRDDRPHAVLVHELVHRVLRAFEDVGIPPVALTQSEVLAHYLEFLYRECLKILNAGRRVHGKRKRNRARS